MLPSLEIKIPVSPVPVTHSDKLLLLGSCFTEHIGGRLRQAKFNVLENPNGILFNPGSVAHSIERYLYGKELPEDELFYLNEIWNHWQFHSRFSAYNRAAAAQQMNESIRQAHQFILKADWLIVTLGSAFQYFLTENGHEVANCHRAPNQWFEKRLLTIEDILNTWHITIEHLKAVNPGCKIIFTISPVRHIRDGVVDNNRSKARLLEAVHTLVDRYEHCYYFPAYEIVIDVLRDYRFYDLDMVHPNFEATHIVWQYFSDTYFSAATSALNKRINEVETAFRHRAHYPQTEAHRKFRASFLAKTKQLAQELPALDWHEELAYFSE